jgi:hypothetical protein
VKAHEQSAATVARYQVRTNPREHADRLLGALGYCLDSIEYWADLGDWIRVNEYAQVAQCHRRALLALEVRQGPAPLAPGAPIVSTQTR